MSNELRDAIKMGLGGLSSGKVSARVNRVGIEYWNAGHPAWVTLRFYEDEGSAFQEIRRLHPADLHDLRYAIDRALAELRSA